MIKSGNFTNFTVKQRKSHPSVPHLHERVVRETIERAKGVFRWKGREKNTPPSART